jgi:hypothetical protein
VTTLVTVMPIISRALRRRHYAFVRNLLCGFFDNEHDVERALHALISTEPQRRSTGG